MTAMISPVSGLSPAPPPVRAKAPVAPPDDATAAAPALYTAISDASKSTIRGNYVDLVV